MAPGAERAELDESGGAPPRRALLTGIPNREGDGDVMPGMTWMMEMMGSMGGMMHRDGMTGGPRSEPPPAT